jgi:hypothetical protein
MRKIGKSYFGGVKINNFIAFIILLVLIFLGYFYYKNNFVKEKFQNVNDYAKKLYDRDKKFKKENLKIIAKVYDSPIPYTFACDIKKNESICRFLLPNTVEGLKKIVEDKDYFLNYAGVNIDNILRMKNRKLNLQDFQENGIAESITYRFLYDKEYIILNLNSDMIYNNKNNKLDIYDKRGFNIKTPKYFINLYNKKITPSGKPILVEGA